MWYPVSLDIENLITHVKSHFPFRIGETILLLGENGTQEGADSNGSGKSTLINGLEIALIGETSRGVNKENFIRWNEDSCRTVLLLKNDVLKREMLIDRSVFVKKTQELIIKINGEIKFNTAKDKNLAPADKYILDEIGISSEDLLNYFIIGQSNENSFFKANDTKQKEIIGRFSNSTIVDNLSKKFEDDFDGKEKEKNLIDSYISVLLGSIEQYKNDLVELNENFSKDKKDKLDSLESDKVDFVEERESLEKEIEDLSEEIKLKDKEILLKGSKLVDISSYEKKIKELKENKEEKQEEIDETTKVLSQLNTYKGGVLECPGCKLKFNPSNDKLTPQEVDDSIVNCKELKEESEKELESIKESINKNKNKINENDILVREIKSLKSSLEQNNTSKKTKAASLQKYSDKILDIDNKISALRKKKKPDEEPLKEKITKQEDNIKVFKDQVLKLQKEMEESSFYKFHFSNKGFKTFLANKSIKSIQDIVNYYLKKFDIGLQTKISGFTLLKNGDLRDKISISVLDNTSRIKDYKTFSRGERARLDLCSRIALNKLILTTVEYGKGLDCLILDELDGLDSEGTNKIVDIFVKSKMTSLLILQHIKGIKHKNIIVVEKINNVSKLKYE